MAMNYIIDGLLYGFGGIIGVACGLIVIGLFALIVYGLSKL